MLLLITYWKTWCCTARDKLSSSLIAHMHTHRVLQSNWLSEICISETPLWPPRHYSVLCLLHLLDFACHSCLNLMTEWKSVKLLSCIYFSLHSFYFPMKLYKHFLFTLLLQKCCLLASVRWSCLNSHNYVPKQQTYTDIEMLPQTSVVVVNYLFLWDCREIYGPISAVFGKPSSKDITSKSLLFIGMLHCLAWKPADNKNRQT